ncbi:helix-hairpin-helix domain-containing protein [uncultured Chitinophaga sp.]|jgi:DNA uptake protein and related DNA-binding proteins|uniref:ComEA family DNA-binding protein n=1 Tax=uncultured Chitinophaga sp. TaxID=339340 RepID=UPI00260E9D1D|nr:helix-hairpin-helix domain-containing protein [uncultured Chitinophaga sp.]
MKKRLLQNQLTFTKQEQRGILVLLALIAITVGVPRLRENWLPATLPADSTFAAEVRAFQQQLAAADTVKTRNRTYTPYPRKTLAKQPVRLQRDTFPARFPRRKPLVISVNTADAAAWEALPGIGPTLAARVVRFREKLGGFYSIAQVAETYGLPDSTFNKIQASLRLDSGSLKKLNINQMDEKSLGQHPYIRYKLARLIVQYRNNHGPFSRPEDLYNIPLVNDSIYRKLEKYINL